ncbi:MAG: tetratricopeptide repeat protein [Planctomycetota bacterium]|nr:tetratricopeptide repeat protein [Planctomycetota bacterium]
MNSSPDTNRVGVFALVLSVVAVALAIVSIVRPTPEPLPSDEDSPQASAQEEPSPNPRASVSTAPTPVEAKPEVAVTRPSESTIKLVKKQIPATKDELEAEATFVATQLLELIPNEPMAMHVNAMLYAQLHQTEKAEKLWQECVKLDPQVEQYYVNLAAIAMDRGDNAAAIETLQEARKLGLDSVDISHHLGLSLTNEGRAEEALPMIETALKQQPGSASLLMILGQAQLKLGDPKSAETNLRKAVDLGARTKSGYFALFNACMRNGNREDAKKFQKVYSSFTEKKLDPQERYQVLSEAEARNVAVSVLSESALLYEAAGGEQDMEQLLLRTLALQPDNLASLTDLARLYGKQKRTVDEKVVRERIVELDPTNLLGYLLLAKTEIAAGNVKAAEGSIKLAISLAPQMVTGYAAMTDFLLEQNQPEKAIWYVNHALKLQPSKQGFLLLAKTFRAMGREVQAQKAESEAAKF